MNLLDISKKRTVTKLKDNGFVNVLGEQHIEYFDYQNRITTSHLDSRSLTTSAVPGSKVVGSMTASEILCAERN